MLTLVAKSAVPAFPGATNNLSAKLLCAIFHVIACSLPPDPNTKIFIVVFFAKLIPFLDTI